MGEDEQAERGCAGGHYSIILAAMKRLQIGKIK
jgi:hypothetical protein